MSLTIKTSSIGTSGGKQHAGAGHTPFVESLENVRQLAVARHEELNGDKINNRGVDGGEQKQRENNTDDDGENVTERSAERAADKNLSHVTQHVVADAFSAGCIDVAVYDLQSAERVHGEPEQSGKDADFDHDHQDGRRGSFDDRWTIFRAPGIEFHYAGGIGNRFNAGERQDDADEAGPVVLETSVQRLKMAEGFADVRQAKEPQNNNDDGRWNRNQKSEPAGLFRSEQIEHADDQDRHGGEFFGMRHAEILKSGKRADGRGHQIIGDEQKRADDGDDFAAMPHARINAAAVRIKAADDHVIDADERGENAHRRDEPERGIAGDGKGEADDVGFARAPVAVKNRGRARNIDIARALNVSWNQIFIPKRDWLARRAVSLQQARLRAAALAL